MWARQPNLVALVKLKRVAVSGHVMPPVVRGQVVMTAEKEVPLRSGHPRLQAHGP